MKFYSKETSTFSIGNDLETKIPVNEVHRFIVSCMEAVGTSRTHASQLADVLVAADVRGHYSHGLNRIEMYVNDVEKKLCDGAAAPTVQKESLSTALVDGCNALGPVVGTYCMNLAISKAKETGVGWVVAKNSNHYGMAGWYSMLASKEGLIGMSFSNAFPVIAPTRSKEKCFGTNPISVAAPGGDPERPFVLDMSSSVVALGKIEVQEKKMEPIPEGWAYDKDGKPTSDPTEARRGSLMPLGGPEETSGYKGYGLAMMVEALSGILSGSSSFGPRIKHWSENTRRDLSQGFVAIDPGFFAPGFDARMEDLMGQCRSLDPMDPTKPVLVPGDPERHQEDRVKADGGITYHISQIKDSYLLSKYLGIEPMRS